MHVVYTQSSCLAPSIGHGEEVYGFRSYSGTYPGKIIIHFSAIRNAAEEEWDLYSSGFQVKLQSLQPSMSRMTSCPTPPLPCIPVSLYLGSLMVQTRVEK